MTMHVVLGDGVMPNKELHAHLQDLWDKDEEDKQNFWFLLQSKAEPSSTDQSLVKWLHDNSIYYEVVGDGAPSDLYENAQEKYSVKRLAPKVVSLMKTTPEEGEDAHILALFASDDPDAQVDRWLNDVISEAADAGFKTFALNDGMVEIDLEDADDEVEAETEEEPVPEEPKKVAATKKAAKAAAKPAEEPEEVGRQLYTRDELENLDISALKEVAAKVGITLAPRTRMATYIDAILGEREEEPSGEVEITPTEDVAVEVEDTVHEVTSTTAYGGSAMVIVVMNGQVIARAVTPDEARAVLA